MPFDPMPGRDRRKQSSLVEWVFPFIGLLLAIGIAFAMGFLTSSTLISPRDQHEMQGKTAADKRYRETFGLPFKDGNPIYAAYPEQQSDRCYYARNHDSADLCAQWRAAVAAEDATNLSKWGLLLSAVATVLSFVGLLALVVTIKQGREALSAARKSNDISRKTAKRELRAYLDIFSTKFKIDNIQPCDIGMDWVGFKIKIKNFGNTPAQSIVVTARSSYIYEGVTYFTDSSVIGGGVAPTHDMKWSTFMKCPREIMEKMALRDIEFRVEIVVTYKDVFENDRKIVGIYVTERGKNEMSLIAGSREST